MKSRFFVPFFSLLALPALAQSQDAARQNAARQNDALEPPAQYTLEINGKAIPMTLGKEVSLNRKAGRTRYLLLRAATRRFDKSGVKFDYPSDYGFEADLSNPNIAIWTLSGRSSLLMLQRFPLTGPALLREQMAREMTAQYGSKNVKSRPAALLLGGRGLEGKRLQVSLAKQNLVQEIFAFSNPKYAFVLMIQDVPQKGKETAEAKELKAILAKSASF